MTIHNLPNFARFLFYTVALMKVIFNYRCRICIFVQVSGKGLQKYYLSILEHTFDNGLLIYTLELYFRCRTLLYLFTANG